MQLETGTVVDRYAVEGLLGQGGMAVVYRVRHRQLGTLHALKLLMLPARSIRERLLQEGRVQARLRHPNTVSVTDVVLIDGAPGLVMEYIPGPSLDELLHHGSLSLDQVDLLARGILDGVAAAHEVGLVHRDLKPGNVLIEVRKDRLVPKITDFGLAKLLGEEGGGTRTRSGLAMGTPCYMAPEQIRNAKGVDARADVFSLGAMLYEMITGQRAFDADDTFEIFSAVTAGEYAPIRERVPEAPDRMVEAVARALITDRDQRVGSVAELAAIWAGGTPAPDAAAAFAPALLARAEELGSGADASSMSWTPAESLEASVGASAPVPPVPERGSETVDWSIADDDEGSPPAPRPQTSSNRDPRIRRVAVFAAAAMTMAFAGLLTVGVVGGGLALTRTMGPSDADGRVAVEESAGGPARSVAKDEGPTEVDRAVEAPPALAEADEGDATAPVEDRPASPAAEEPRDRAPEEVAVGSSAPEGTLGDVDRAAAGGEAGLAGGGAAAEEGEGELAEEGGQDPDPAEEGPTGEAEAPVPTGRVDLITAIHPMTKGASAIIDAWLVSGETRYELPATVPAGSYRIEASFNRKDPVDVGTLEVPEGARLVLGCYAAIKDCRL